jgi:hypothetical protein
VNEERSEGRAGAGLRFCDDDDGSVTLADDEAASIWALTNGFEAATVSACTDCRSRVLAVVALVDLLDAAPPHARARDLIDLADEAPTLHIYVVDDTDCPHSAWRDPGYVEWSEIAETQQPRR